MRTALAYSCNTAFISQHEKVSQDDLVQRGAVARHGREARPALHRLPRLGAGDRRRRRARGVVHRPGPRRGVAADDGPRRRLGHEGPDGAAAARRRRTRPARARDAARPHRGGACCARRCAPSWPRGPARCSSRSGSSTPRPAPPSSARRARPTRTSWMVAGRGDIAIAAYNEVGDNGVTGAAPVHRQLPQGVRPPLTPPRRRDATSSAQAAVERALRLTAKWPCDRR